MILSDIQGVVFDADGTLFDTERVARKAWLGVAREWNVPAVEEHYSQLVGRNQAGTSALLRQICPPDFPLQAFLDACVQRNRALLRDEGVPVKEGAQEIVEFFYQKHLPIALATSSGPVSTGMKLEQSGLGRYFQFVITGDMVSRGKPDPEIYFTSCSRLKIDPAHTLAVEDSPNGIRSAHAAGMPVAMVPDLIPSTPELDALIWKRFDSLTELRNYFQ